MHTFVIAEIGSSWLFGSAPSVQMLDAVSIAKECGADAIKFQWVSDPRKMERRRNIPEGSYDILAWPIIWLPPVAEVAEELGIELICTVFLQEDVEVMNPYIKRWKVASLENQDDELLSAMQHTGKEIIASHGATDSTKWNRRMESKSLHCTAAYPAPIESLNLNVIEMDVFDGYSDHSCNVLTGALAVACGAKIVEVHFKFSNTPKDNPDFNHSLYPWELKEYIGNIRQAERMLGDGIKKIEKCEKWALQHKVKA